MYSDLLEKSETNYSWSIPHPIDALDDFDVDGAGFEAIPEFPTIALPVITVLSIMFLIFRKREKGKL